MFTPDTGWRVISTRSLRSAECRMATCMVDHSTEGNKLYELKHEGFGLTAVGTVRGIYALRPKEGQTEGPEIAASTFRACAHAVHVAGSNYMVPTFEDEHGNPIPAPNEAPSVPAPTPSVPAVVPAAPMPASSDAGEALRQLIGLDTASLALLAQQAATEAVGRLVMPTVVVVERANGAKSEVKDAHPVLADVTALLLSGEHVWMHGPAGSGKTTVAAQAAEALALPFYPVSVGPQTSKADLLGFIHAGGDYVGTVVREAFEHGGLLMLDEIDAAHPGVMTILNAALSNGHMTFPDGVITRHDDFRVCAGANSTGQGADRSYAGRQRQDGATLNRFAFVTVGYNPEVERRMCMSTGLDSARIDSVLAFAGKCRSNIEEAGLAHIVSPRNTVRACRMLANGTPWPTVATTAFQASASAGDWAKISNGAKALA